MASPTKKDGGEFEVVDTFFGFDLGVNTGLRSSLLPRQQLASATNCTVRGGFPSPRPVFRKCTLDFNSDAILQGFFEDGRFQGAAYYEPDDGYESLLSSIGGYQFSIVVNGTHFEVRNITVSHVTATTLDFVVPAVGFPVTIEVISTVNIQAGVPILIDGKNYRVDSIIDTSHMAVINVDAVPGDTVSAGAEVTFWDVNPSTQRQCWIWQGQKWAFFNDGQSVPVIYDGAQSRRSLGVLGLPQEITAGEAGVYWNGRNWWVQPGAKRFRAGDAVYSSSGTGDRRDACLKQSQNAMLTTADFVLPNSQGKITAICPVNVLDTSMGQGPLQVLTPNFIVGCNAPTDETTWTKVTDPILSHSQISYGGLGHWSTVVCNGDMFYRSIDGVRSLILGKRDFNTWGNTPISREVTKHLETDDIRLLKWSSAVVFDNRLLMTCSPVMTEHGCYHRGLVALNFDVISNMQGKRPAVWEGCWSCINVLQLVKGQFGGEERCFAFAINTRTSKIELYELLKSTEKVNVDDNIGSEIQVQWAFETPDMFRNSGIGKGQYLRLDDGEIWLEDVVGPVHVQVFWRPDQHPCWIPWHDFNVCAARGACSVDDNGCLTLSEYKPQFRPANGLGEPPDHCDRITDRKYRNFYTCQIRVEVVGHCRVTQIRLKATQEPSAIFAEVQCD